MDAEKLLAGPEADAIDYRGTLRSSAAGWMLRGACLAGIALLPFGPLGFLAGFLCGGGITVTVGLIVDAIRLSKKKREANKAKKRFEHLIRWTEFIFSDAENPTSLLLYLIREFEAITMTKDYASSLAKRLRDFLERDDVQNCMNEYLQCFFSTWREAGPQEVATFETVLTVCTEAFQGQKRVPASYRRMLDYRNSSAVRQLLLSSGRERAQLKDKADRRADLLSYVEYDDKADRVFRHEFKQHFGPIKKKRKPTGVQSESSDSEIGDRKSAFVSRGSQVLGDDQVAPAKTMLQLPTAIPNPYLRETVNVADPTWAHTRSGSYRSLESAEGAQAFTVPIIPEREATETAIPLLVVHLLTITKAAGVCYRSC